MTNKEFIESVTLPGEEWRDVVGYEGRNLVSSFGRMVTIRTYNYKHKGEIVIRELMKPYIAKDTGYARVSMYKNGKRKTMFVHRIIAEAFIPNPMGYEYIDHINTIRSDNHIENLRWCSASMNVNNLITLGRNKSSHRGVITYRTQKIVQLKNSTIVRIFDSIYKATLEGFDSSCICHCLKQGQKTHKGYHWMYLSDYEKLINKSKNS